MVRNLSNTGAALDLADPDSVPEHFTLVMLADGLRLPGQIVWRKGKRIGVTLDKTVPDGSARSNCVHARRSQRRN
jgi:PilZ domain